MKKESEPSELLADVLAGEDNLRGATLEAALSAMRRRHRRRMRGAAWLVPLLALLAVVGSREFRSARNRGARRMPAEAKVEQVIPGTSIRVIGDEQLLEFFEGRPIALIGPPGHQRLVLLDGAAN